MNIAKTIIMPILDLEAGHVRSNNIFFAQPRGGGNCLQVDFVLLATGMYVVQSLNKYKIYILLKHFFSHLIHAVVDTRQKKKMATPLP